MSSMPPPSLTPPRSESERRVTFIGHSIVNGCAVLALACMHVWGTLGPDLATGAILAVCGVWSFNTRKGLPSGVTGLVGLASWIASMRG